MEQNIKGTIIKADSYINIHADGPEFDSETYRGIAVYQNSKGIYRAVYLFNHKYSFKEGEQISIKKTDRISSFKVKKVQEDVIAFCKANPDNPISKELFAAVNEQNVSNTKNLEAKEQKVDQILASRFYLVSEQEKPMPSLKSIEKKIQEEKSMFGESSIETAFNLCKDRKMAEKEFKDFFYDNIEQQKEARQKNSIFSAKRGPSI